MIAPRVSHRRPRVAVVGPLPPPTHGHMVVTERVLSSCILQESFEMLHVDVSDHSPLDDIGRLSGRNVWLGLVHAVRLWRTVRRKRADLAYVPLAQNRLGLLRDGVLMGICMLHGVKVAGHVHGGGFADFLEDSPAWFSTPMLRLLRRCELLVAMSDEHRSTIERVLPTVPNVVLPHGVPSWLDRSRPVPGPLRVLYVSSSLSESKGTFVALEAARCLHDAHVPVEWTIVGPWRNAATRATGLDIVQRLPNVRFTGEATRDELALLYADSDVFVFPTGPREGFGMVRIEALAAGLPVITTPAGGGNEIVGDAGFIVPFDAPSELAERIRQLDEDRGLLAELGERAQRRHRTLFSEATFERGLHDTWCLALTASGAAAG